MHQAYKGLSNTIDVLSTAERGNWGKQRVTLHSYHFGFMFRWDWLHVD